MTQKFEVGDKVRYIGHNGRMDIGFKYDEVYTISYIVENSNVELLELKFAELPMIGSRYAWKFELVEGRQRKYPNFLDILSSLE